jgi:hypothetical protein
MSKFVEKGRNMPRLANPNTIKTKSIATRVPEVWLPQIDKQMKKQAGALSKINVDSRSSLGRWLFAQFLEGKVRADQ